MQRNRPLPVILMVVFLVIFCLCCMCILLVLAFFPITRSSIQIDTLQTLAGTATPTPVLLRPGITPTPGENTEPGDPGVSLNLPADPSRTVEQLTDTLVPINDIYDLARRLEGKQDISPTLEPPAVPPQVGDQKDFWITNNDTNNYFQTSATLQHATEHAYFWIEDGVRFRENELVSLGDVFENQIYPTNREFFGSEWTPGVDGDPHIYILYARDLGSSIVGYFSSNDSYNPLVQEYSNGHEMFVINADNANLDEVYTYGVLAHEFQ
ncbi:MAG: hypothetical protein ACWGO1_14025, partial [Anaerolineales bacterium]